MADRAPDRPDTAPTFALRIEELVLHGFARIDRHRVASAIERELARLLRDPAAHDPLRWRGAMEGEAAAHRLDAGAFIVPHDATPDAVGAQVAQAIYRGMTPGVGPGAAAPPSSRRTPTRNAGTGA
jgi:hypothetical protein